MSDRKRFRVVYDHDPGFTVGQRVVFPPDFVTEEWDTSTGVGRSYVPKPVSRYGDPRPGIVARVIDRTAPLDPGPTRWDVIAEDVPPRETPTGVVMTVIGPRMYTADMNEVRLLLGWLANRRVADDADAAGIAVAVGPWLRRRFPRLAMAVDLAPEFADEPEGVAARLYAAYLAGVESIERRKVMVPAPPFEIHRKPTLSENLRVRADALTRMLGRHRAN